MTNNKIGKKSIKKKPNSNYDFLLKNNDKISVKKKESNKKVNVCG